MSLLLDALNKADRERKRNEAMPGINSNHEQVKDDPAHKKIILISLVLVAGFALLLASIYWLGQRSVTSATTREADNTSASTTRSSPVTQSTEPKNANSSVSQKVAGEQSKIASENISTATEIDTSDENVASLYQQNIPAQTNATLTINSNIDAPINQAPAASEQATLAPTSITQFANLPDLHDLPSQVLEKIPSLNYSEHNYNSNGGSVKINGSVHHANDQLGAGLVIDKILEDGMILHIDNYAFKMRALNSWVNM